VAHYHRLRIAAALFTGIPGFSSGKEQVFSVKPIKESKMSQKPKSEIPMSKRFFPELLSIIGGESHKQVGERYRELFSSYERPNNLTLQHHLIEGILPGLACYQSLREGDNSREIKDKLSLLKI
jgi:hypothetical protein